MCLASIAATPRLAFGTTLPYTETLGDLTSSGCDVQWTGGVCETGWSGWGDQDTLEMVTAVGSSPTLHGIQITPGTSFWNGVTKDFDVTGGHVLKWSAPVVPVDGTADFAIRAVFKNSSGATVGVQTQVFAVDNIHTIEAYFQAPSSAVLGSLFFGAKDGSQSGTKVVIASVCLPLAGCTFGGQDVVMWPELECNPPPECPACEECCPNGDDAIPVCIIDYGECVITSRTCECADTDEFKTTSDWQ